MLRVAAMSLSLLLLASIAAGQPSSGGDPEASAPGTATAEWQGLGFEGRRVRAAPVAGTIELAARRAHIWTHPPGSNDPYSTRRVYLTGDVAVRMANTVVFGSRATVWLQRLPTSATGIAGEVYQAYAVVTDARSPNGPGGISITADEIPVQGVIAITGPVRLHVDLGSGGRPTDGDAAETLEAAERGFVAAFRGGPRRADRPQTDRQPAGTRRPSASGDTNPAGTGDPTSSDRSGESTTGEPEPVGSLGGAPEPTAFEPIFPADATVFLSAGEQLTVRPVGDPDDEAAGSAILVSGGAVLQIVDHAGGQDLQLQAQRAVVFTAGRLDSVATRLGIGEIRGIYLEGGVVAGDDRYTLRGTRVYFDVEAQRGLVADSVLWTYDQRRNMPLYARADRIRQTARDTWLIEEGRFSNSPYATPPLSVGATDLRVTQGSDGQPGRVDASNITLRVGDIPVLYWPRARASDGRFPLRTLSFGDSNREGPSIKTRWDALALLNLNPGEDVPSSLEASVDLDYYFERGFGFGAELQWDEPGASGALRGYILPEDTGEDVLTNGVRLDRDGGTRGMFTFEQRLRVTERWELLAELGWISDERYLPALDPRTGRESREITNRAVLRNHTERGLFTLTFQGTALDFLPNEYLLQSQGFTVDRLPEARYASAVLDPFHETLPGLLTYQWEASLGLLRPRFSEVESSSLGFVTDPRATEALGTLASQSQGDVLRAAGFTEDIVTRFDTRHELSVQLKPGVFSVTPYAIGRVTLYDSSFPGISPEQDDKLRLWGAVGVDVSTVISGVDDSVQNSALDLHRIRHIVEPVAGVMIAGSTVSSDDLPVFDDEVESILQGTVARIGVDQTWQTKRGGPGRWRSVDVLTLRTGYVWTSDNAHIESPIPRFAFSRPETSNAGEHAYAEAVYRFTESIAFSGEVTYSFENDNVARWSAGVLVRHAPAFSTTAEVRSIDPRDATYATVVTRYDLTEKYNASLISVYDFDEGDFQTLGGILGRRFATGTLFVNVNHNNIRNETSFGLSFAPRGLRSRFGVSGLGSQAQQF